ncbi:hypothetical protein DUNSADRAFT_14497 [Dunaliella salina]|uniref:Uncharacterized protein n=1 Tax=Dunaliella salina TaxID=3046 RepID=A0ABQ7H2L1_DUNSA|nr:hypothetical protein DUNSADRAFT_14497 [Dunaliella salina]|eukprot:KAF5841098.1 hypothetical protein DUNSADRAFT_14497 [Dunaliella salina]
MASSIFRQLHNNDVASVRKIISMYETAVTIKNNQDHTALHVAALKGNPEIVRELLRARAPHDALDGQGNTPMHLAAESGSVEVVAELLSGLGRRTVLRMKNKEGRTPLHMAAKAHHVGVVAALMQAGACAAIKDKSGATPLELVPNLQLDDPVVQALVGHAAAAQSPKASTPNATRGSSTSNTVGNATPSGASAASPSPSLRASREGLSASTDTGHTRAVAAAASAAAAAPAAGISPTPARRAPGSGLPPPPSIPTPSSASANFRSSMDADTFSRAMTPAGMRRLRASSVTPSRPPPTVRPPVSPQKRRNSGDSDVGEQNAAGDAPNIPQAVNRKSEVGIGANARESLTGSSRQTSRQNSTARRGESVNNGDWRKVSGAGELLEAHDAALRELNLSVQRVEEQHADLVELQGKVKDAEGANARVLEEHGAAMKELERRMAAVEAQEAALHEVQEGLQELQAGAQDLNSRGDLLDRAILIQGEHAEQLAQARAAMSSQSSLPRIGGNRLLNQVHMCTVLLRFKELQQIQQSSKYGQPPPQLPELQLQQLTQQITEQVTKQVTAQVTQQLSQELSQKVQQHVAQHPAVREDKGLEAENMRHRISKLEEVGVGDQLAVVQLRLQQLSSQLADGLGNGITFSEAGDRLSTLMAWYRQENERRQQGDSWSSPSPPPAASWGTGVQSSSLSMSAASTPLSVGAGAAARTRQATAAAAAESARAEEFNDLRKDLKSLQGQLSSQVASVEGLRGELKSALATVRREWEVAVETAAVRHAEQMAEGKAREDRLKSMRDAAMADDEARRKALDLEAHVLQGLKSMENSLSLVQHKMEVLEEQLEEVSTNAAESSMAAENTAAELAALKSSVSHISARILVREL